MNTMTKNMLLTPFNLLYRFSPEIELKLMFRLKQGYKLNLKNPKTYSEKLQWIKLYDKNELIPKCCDKYTVREYVENSGCGDLLNTLYWHGTAPEDIPYDLLPSEFVIKVTHGSTYNIIVTDKTKLDQDEINRKLRKWMKSKFIPCYGEDFYGKVPPQIIVEKYLEDSSGSELLDYKVFCFNGKAKFIDVHSRQGGIHRRNLYSLDWKRLPVKIKFDNFEEVDKPAILDELIQTAEKLSENFYHARVDFFVVNNKLYFGELTFTSGAGFSHISPKNFDRKMGEWLKLPVDEKGHNK